MVVDKVETTKSIWDSQWVKILGLIGTALGVIFGFRAMYNWIFVPDTGIRIDYDPNNSLMVFTLSDEPELHNKLALMLFKLSFVGNGNNPYYARSIDASIRCNGEWIEGNQLIPKKFKEEGTSEQSAIVTRIVKIHGAQAFVTEDLLLVGWKDFTPSEKGLSAGQPFNFSYAVMFDLGKRNPQLCDQISLRVVDYSDNHEELTLTDYKLFSSLNRAWHLCLADTEKCHRILEGGHSIPFPWR
jgi:hypothetical protein